MEWKRLAGMLGTVVVGGIVLSLLGGPSLKYMLAPGALLLVLGMTFGLGLFTYDRKRYFRELKAIFIPHRSGRDSHPRRMLSQLALYALVSGIVLAILQILLQSFRTQGGFDRIGSNPIALREPLTTLLYAVLTGLGLWLLAGKKESVSNESEAVRLHRQTMIGASLLLFMTTGLVLLLIVGMTKDSFRQSQEKSISEGTPVKAVSNEADGLYQGEDLYWRPKSMLGSTGPETGGDMVTKMNTPYSVTDLMVSDAAAIRGEEMPLRWELSLVKESPAKDIFSPESSNPALSHMD
jgi:uncharacterized iron-regulated membrane protein